MSKWTFGTLMLALLTVTASAYATPPTIAAPEIDGAGAIAAIGLLAGVVALIAEKHRQK